MKWRIGIFCGERLFSIKSWKSYWGYKVSKPSRSFGPILLYKVPPRK